MKNINNLLLSLFLGLALSAPAFAQTSLNATTLSASVAVGSSSTSNTTIVRVASATGITATSTVIYVDTEAMFVNSVNGTTLGVTRGYNGTKVSGHISGAMVLAGPPPAFVSFDPAGTCTNGNGLFQYSPVVNITNGNQWLCGLLGKVIPGFVNSSNLIGVSTAVASAAGLITPSGPFFHITGTSAITGFNVPVGFDPKGGGQICVVPDGIFTTTNANNIALASTAVVNKTLCWAYDGNSGKFTPSY
jgi:hypothetical protein